MADHPPLINNEYELPAAFVAQMEKLLPKEELPIFLASYGLPYCRGLRVNPLKSTGAAIVEEGIISPDDPVPWEEWGYYLPVGSGAGSHLFHSGGAYYIQEPSAMAAVNVLGPKPGEWVLDLCAAPGGKSGQIASALMGKGLLVANEPMGDRARVLSGNLERLGVTNALVTSAYPDQLAKSWPGLFHRILVDAPCSGEGMFRRHPETRSQWSEVTPEGCAKRQRDILSQAAMMLRPGGVMVYSTCTLNDKENEGVVETFLITHSDFSLMPFSLDVGRGTERFDGMVRFLPHRIRGEGHFIALFQKKGYESDEALKGAVLPPPSKEAAKGYAAFCGELGLAESPACSGTFGNTLVSAPSLPDVARVKVLRIGLRLGEWRGKVFHPNHSWAMADKGILPSVEIDETQAERYLHGEVLSVPETLRGWYIVTYKGLSLGWGKASGGMLKNHYPKGLRL